jgi:DNA-binding NarL/FixJ family response regulator
MRVLLVDDHAVVRLGLKAAFAVYDGIEIIGEAATAQEAIALCQQLEPDVVLMDYFLPDMDGITALKQIRASCPSIKSLLLTSAGDLAESEVLAAGFNAIMRKDSTTDIETIIDLVRSFDEVSH